MEAAMEFAVRPARGAASRSVPGPPWGWLLLGLGVAALAVAYGLRGALTPFAFAAVLCYIVAPTVEYLHRRARFPRPLAILTSYAFLALGLWAFTNYILPDLVGELQRLILRLPGYAAALERQVGRWRAGYGRLPLPPALRQALDQALARVAAGARAALSQALGGLVGAFGLVVPIVLAPVLAYYFLSDLPRLRAEFARLLPPAARQPTMSCLGDLNAVLAGWIRGQLLLAAVVATLATVAVLLLHLRFAFTLGLVAGIGELIPYFGPVLGALPALAVAVGAGGLGLAAWTALAFLAIQQLESVFLAPRIVGGAVGLHPLTVIAALLIGERLAGLPGIVLAIPAAGCLRVLGRHTVRALTATRAPRRLR